MPSVTLPSPINHPSDSTLTLAYDSINVIGTDGYLVNPRIEFYAKPGWFDNNNYIDALGNAITLTGSPLGRVHTSPANGKLTGGTVTWWLAPIAVPLTVGVPTYRSLGVFAHGISFYNGDSGSTTFNWSGGIEFPALPNPGGQPNVRVFGGLRQRFIRYTMPDNRQYCILYLQANGKPIRVRISTSNTVASAFDMNVGMPQSIPRVGTLGNDPFYYNYSQRLAGTSISRFLPFEFILPASLVPAALILDRTNASTNAMNVDCYYE